MAPHSRIPRLMLPASTECVPRNGAASAPASSPIAVEYAALASLAYANARVTFGRRRLVKRHDWRLQPLLYAPFAPGQTLRFGPSPLFAASLLRSPFACRFALSLSVGPRRARGCRAADAAASLPRTLRLPPTSAAAFASLRHRRRARLRFAPAQTRTPLIPPSAGLPLCGNVSPLVFFVSSAAGPMFCL